MARYTGPRTKRSRRVRQLLDENKAKYYQKLGATFLVTRRKIFNDSFKTGVIKQANYLFRRRGFVESLDLEPLLIGTGNGEQAARKAYLLLSNPLHKII